MPAALMMMTSFSANWGIWTIIWRSCHIFWDRECRGSGSCPENWQHCTLCTLCAHCEQNVHNTVNRLFRTVFTKCAFSHRECRGGSSCPRNLAANWQLCSSCTLYSVLVHFVLVHYVLMYFLLIHLFLCILYAFTLYGEQPILHNLCLYSVHCCLDLNKSIDLQQRLFLILLHHDRNTSKLSYFNSLYCVITMLH